MRIAYCGYDFFWGCLSKLVDLGHDVIEIYTWPTDNEYDFNDNIFRLAKKINCPLKLSPLDEEDLVRLGLKDCDVILTAAYPYKIPPFENYVRFGINLHPSPLPFGRGPWPLPWIILKQLSESAVCFHKISSQFDAGDLLFRRDFQVLPNENLETLSVRVQLLAIESIEYVFANLERLADDAVAQGPGSYWPMPTDTDRMLDFLGNVSDIDRVARAFGKFDSNAILNGHSYLVQDLSCWKQEHSFQPGSVVHRSNRETVVAALDGLVCIRALKSMRPPGP